MIRDISNVDESKRPYNGLVGGSNARKSIADRSEVTFDCENRTRDYNNSERSVLLAVSCRP